MKAKTLLPFLGIGIVGSIYLSQDNIPSESSVKSSSTIHQVSNGLITKNTVRQWQPIKGATRPTQTLPNEVEVTHIQVQANAFEKLKPGEKLTLFIPQENQNYIGTVQENHTQFGGQVQVSKGSIDDGHPFSSFSVTKGSELTLVMVSTGEKVYQIEINNKTGEGTVIDDQALDFFRQHDDGEITPPEGLS